MAFSRETAVELLRRAHAGDRLAHAYLISGASEAATRAVAAELAGLVVGERAATFDHPDVHVAEPESKSRRIRIEQTRALERELQMRSLLGGRKVAVLVNAERMTTEAANSFLKTLEEPPANSLLVLTATAPETLPDTILSRCIALPLSEGEAAEPSEAQRELLAALRRWSAEKSPGVAGAFRLVQAFLQPLRQARERVAAEHGAALKSEEARYKQTTESNAYFDDREDFYKALTESRYILERFGLVDTLIQWWGDVLRRQQGYEKLDLPAVTAETAALAQRFNAPEVLRRFAALEDLRENLNRSGVQEQLAIEVAFLEAFS